MRQNRFDAIAYSCMCANVYRFYSNAFHSCSNFTNNAQFSYFVYTYVSVKFIHLYQSNATTTKVTEERNEQKKKEKRNTWKKRYNSHLEFTYNVYSACVHIQKNMVQSVTVLFLPSFTIRISKSYNARSICPTVLVCNTFHCIQILF